MAETKRLGPFGWFVRAFAAGFGATCGVVVAAVVVIAGCHALIAAGVLAYSPLGGIELKPADTPAPVSQNPPPTTAPAYPTPVEPYRHVGDAYGAGSSAGGDAYSADPVRSYPPASRENARTGEADAGTPPADAQLAPPMVTIPSEPPPSMDPGAGPSPETPPQER
jgi:hypothetical protein